MKKTTVSSSSNDYKVTYNTSSKGISVTTPTITITEAEMANYLAPPYVFPYTLPPEFATDYPTLDPELISRLLVQISSYNSWYLV